MWRPLSHLLLRCHPEVPVIPTLPVVEEGEVGLLHVSDALPWPPWSRGRAPRPAGPWGSWSGSIESPSSGARVTSAKSSGLQKLLSVGNFGLSVLGVAVRSSTDTSTQLGSFDLSEASQHHLTDIHPVQRLSVNWTDSQWGHILQT